jgi:prepilin-type N-terminal cleavage/methylation domain-containing protein
MFKKAFTLAEILIVMAIIGTVAVATIPNLVDSYQEDKDIAKLRGVFHDLEVAYAKAVAEYGPIYMWTDNSTQRAKILMKYVKSTYCGTDKNNSCYPSNVYGNDITYLKYELENGVGLAIYISKSPTNTGRIYVSLGGAKGRVNVGKNIFRIDLNSSNSVYPYGKNLDRQSNGAFKTSAVSYNATNWAITNGNMDYLKCANKLNWTNQTSCP